MKTGIAMLVLAYMLSQFYRAFLAVLAPALEADLGALPDQLSFASGLWFLTFALMQIPVGWALDRFGPRRTAAVLLALGGGGGAALFALAGNAMHIQIAMALMGIGCAPVLMASYYIFARNFPPRAFATLAGAIIGLGSLGNIASSLPMAWASEAFGWRASLFALSAITLAVALAIFLLVKDPERQAHEAGAKGSVLGLLAMPALWFIFPMMFVNYAAAAGIRGLWIGPYLDDVFAADASTIGLATLAMGLAMAAGNFAYGPLDRLFRTRKWVVFFGNLSGAACLFALWFNPAGSLWFSVAMLALLGLFASSFPVIMAHGRSFIPAHLTGRGVTLLNLFGIGGAGILQALSGHVHGAAAAYAATAGEPYQALFLFFGAIVLAGTLLYLFSRDNTA